MKQQKQQNGQTMNLLFTMLLFLVFVLCALFTVLIGGKVYENINSRIEENYSGQVVLIYVANKVRQGDRADSVTVREIEGVPVLELSQQINGSSYITWIYYRDGAVCELFSDPADGLGLEDGLKILECEGFDVGQSEDKRIIHIATEGEGSGSLSLALRSGGGIDE